MIIGIFAEHDARACRGACSDAEQGGHPGCAASWHEGALQRPGAHPGKAWSPEYGRVALVHVTGRTSPADVIMWIQSNAPGVDWDNPCAATFIVENMPHALDRAQRDRAFGQREVAQSLGESYLQLVAVGEGP